jgi:hypothetical protein
MYIIIIILNKILFNIIKRNKKELNLFIVICNQKTEPSVTYSKDFNKFIKIPCIIILIIFNYTTYNNKNAIINANNPVASEKANPKIAYANNCPLNEGFLDTPIIRAPKTVPIPIPAPIKPVVAKPVPIILAA